ncbi:MAG TPA: ornithine carbamoyltransferase [Candidatus Acidoferrum sp.]|jgi:ornithine carbamoyltransferase|nr:ornithine carbamoyltransferase [Candidatus Acidoferrum sp.]
MISSVGALAGRDFLDIADLQPAELRDVLELAHGIKAGRRTGKPLEGRHIALLFQKPSHRTRVSFEVGIGRLGGRVTNLTEQDIQLGVRESVGDAARVLDSYVDGVVARMRLHADLLELAAASKKPVINALTNRSHPCQILADLMTIEEVCGPLAQQTVAYIGDGNNIAVSLVEAAERMGFSLVVVTPPGYAPPANLVDGRLQVGSRGSGITLSTDVADVAGATAIYTDVWASMGQESEREVRRKTFAGYQVNDAVMARAPGAVFMHCLPAHRGEEVTDEVIDGPRSVVFQQAANRLYAQMALMAQLFGAAQ